MSPKSLMLGLSLAAVLTAPAHATSDEPRNKSAAKKSSTLQPADANQIAAADRVIYGRYACEFNQLIDIDRHANQPGYVQLRYKKQAWTMKPVVSPSGAIRMEDIKGVALMLQIANKSMLMNTKSGQRMVDGCVMDGQRSASLSPPTH